MEAEVKKRLADEFVVMVKSCKSDLEIAAIADVLMERIERLYKEERGKVINLAIAADIVVGANAKSVSFAIIELEKYLNAYKQTNSKSEPVSPPMTKEKALNTVIVTSPDIDTNKISDGFHTFGELYEHRIVLFIALCRRYANGSGFDEGVEVWRSKNHSDGKPAFGGGWFVLGINKEKGKQITYHLPDAKWDECNFCETLDVAPEFDGHTAEDVLERIKQL